MGSQRAIPPELIALRRQWLILTTAATAVLVIGCIGLAGVWRVDYAARWGALSAVLIGYELALLRRELPSNHRLAEDALLPELGAGNLLSISRGILIALIGGFLIVPAPGGWLSWLPGILYLVASIIDYLDGYVARVTDHTTLLGEMLDLEYDGLGVLIVPSLAVVYGQLPPWYLLVSAARYLFMFGIWRLNRQGKPIYNLTSSVYRRALAGLQMGFVALALLPIFSRPDTWIVASIFMLPFLVGFARDWLVVSGQIDPAMSGYVNALKVVESLFTGWLPLVFRVLFVGLAIWFGIGHIQTGSVMLVFETPILGWGFALFEIAAAFLIMLGMAGRITALTLLILMSLIIMPDHMDLRTALIVCAAALVVLGTGRFSVWRPEDLIIQRRFGGKQHLASE